jgi:hypothetical protein
METWTSWSWEMGRYCLPLAALDLLELGRDTACVGEERVIIDIIPTCEDEADRRETRMRLGGAVSGSGVCLRSWVRGVGRSC